MFHTQCGQMMPDLWNVTKPLEVQFRQLVHQSNNKSNGDRKGKRSNCFEEIGGQEHKSRRDQQSSRQPLI